MLNVALVLALAGMFLCGYHWGQSSQISTDTVLRTADVRRQLKSPRVARSPASEIPRLKIQLAELNHSGGELSPATTESNPPAEHKSPNQEFTHLMRECSSVRVNWLTRNVLNKMQEPWADKHIADLVDGLLKSSAYRSPAWKGHAALMLDDSAVEVTGYLRFEWKSNSELPCFSVDVFFKKDGAIYRANTPGRCGQTFARNGVPVFDLTLYNTDGVGDWLSALIIPLDTTEAGHPLEYLPTNGSEEYRQTDFSYTAIDEQNFEREISELIEADYQRRYPGP